MMKKQTIEGKKIRVILNNKDFFFTVKQVLELTDTHLTFLDKFGAQKTFRVSDIAEIFEDKSMRGRSR